MSNKISVAGHQSASLRGKAGLGYIAFVWKQLPDVRKSLVLFCDWFPICWKVGMLGTIWEGLAFPKDDLRSAAHGVIDAELLIDGPIFRND